MDPKYHEYKTWAEENNYKIFNPTTVEQAKRAIAENEKKLEMEKKLEREEKAVLEAKVINTALKDLKPFQKILFDAYTRVYTGDGRSTLGDIFKKLKDYRYFFVNVTENPSQKHLIKINQINFNTWAPVSTEISFNIIRFKTFRLNPSNNEELQAALKEESGLQLGEKITTVICRLQFVEAVYPTTKDLLDKRVQILLKSALPKYEPPAVRTRSLAR